MGNVARTTGGRAAPQCHACQESLSRGPLDPARWRHHSGDRLRPARGPRHPHWQGRQSRYGRRVFRLPFRRRAPAIGGNAQRTPMSLSTEQQRMVLDAAVKLAFTQELSSISLEDLTKASGISAFDIVRHYHSKENILAAVLERELELIAGSVPSPELRFPGETLKDELQVLAKIM